MLTLAELTELERTLRDTRVLSVYVSTRTSDPSRRRSWWPTLQASLRAWAATLDGAGRAERAEFAAARDALEHALSETPHAETDGVACFASATGVVRIDPLPFAIETTVAWGHGPALAPLVRALKEERAVLMAVLDGKSATLYRYQFETMARVDTVTVDPRSVDPTHAPARVSPKFHSGVRGTSGQDEAQHDWAAATDRLVREVAHRLAHYANGDAWILVGGRRGVAQKVMTLLPPALRRHAERVDDITHRSPRDALIRVARAGASRLRNAADAEAIDRIAERSAVASAAVGDVAALHALQLARVQELYLTTRFVKDHAADAEAAVRAALAQGARVETVSGAASARLDAMGGIAARLRYAVRPADATAAGLLVS